MPVIYNAAHNYAAEDSCNVNQDERKGGDSARSAEGSGISRKIDGWNKVAEPLKNIAELKKEE